MPKNFGIEGKKIGITEDKIYSRLISPRLERLFRKQLCYGLVLGGVGKVV